MRKLAKNNHFQALARSTYFKRTDNGAIYISVYNTSLNAQVKQ